MFSKRWIGLALVALLLIGVISAVSGAGQRDAWMQGYLAGRLSTGEDDGSALTPYLMARGEFGSHYGGFGAGLNCLIGLGFLLFGLFFVSRTLHRVFGSNSDEWRERMRAEADRWHERHHSRQGERTRDRDDDSTEQTV